MSADVLDLFGNAWVDKPAKRGRPVHDVTKRTRRRVSMLVALGWGNPRIASTVGVTLPTLHKHYFYELRQRDQARDRLEARRLEVAWELAEGGNVGALREFARLLDRNDRMEAERSMGAVSADQKPPTDTGKKVTDKLRAMEADAELAAQLELEAQDNVSLN
ncbi:MAG: hypothetical protein Q8M31_18355 [Beijerinckiaceae bacterium]|nr:hypothetical protein [Beijerinckiaceae bacterium]